MHFALHELVSSLAALATLPVFFLAPGYLIATCTDVMHFRGQTWVERLIWATALSEPIALLLAVHPGIPLSPAWTMVVFSVFLLMAVGLFWRDARRLPLVRPSRWRKSTRIGATAALIVVVYSIAAAAPIAFHGRLYESAVWQDWNVRIQLVNAAIRGGNHPLNPMFTPEGRPAALRYYYFWYVLCARMHDFVPGSARSVFAASCAGSGLSVLAFLLLSLKYLGTSRQSLRKQGVALLLVSCVIGLDLLPAALLALHHRMSVNVQFWLDDRSPSWLHMVLWAPHHVAGLECCGLAVLLLLRAAEQQRRQQVVHCVLAAVCFAAAVGTSTFVTMLFASACMLLFLHACWRREWVFVWCALGAGLLSLALAAPFLHGMRQAAGSAADGAHHGLLRLRPRYMDQGLHLTWSLLDLGSRAIWHHGIPAINPQLRWLRWTLWLLRPPMLALLFALDFGFFAIVLLAQGSREFRTGWASLTRRNRDLWLLFAGIVLPGFLLNSAALQTNNDLGRHASFCAHFVLLLWATPMVSKYFKAYRAGVPFSWLRGRPLPVCVAVVCAAIGLLGLVAQVFLDRTRMLLTDADLVPRVVVAERIPHLGVRFAQVEQAMAAADRATGSAAVVQGNPNGRLAPVLLLYTNRQMAASDDGCNTPFGGDPTACAPMALAFIELFGGTGRHYQGASNLIKDAIPYQPTRVTVQRFQEVCTQYRLTLLVATYADPAWQHPDTWVWQQTPLFGNSTARVFACRQT